MAAANTEKKITVATAKKGRGRKPVPKPKYKCLICGMEKDEVDFYKAKGSLIWSETGDRCLFCKDCLSGKFRLLRERHGERLATMMMCHYIDSYWNNSIYESVINNNTDFDFGFYVRQLNQLQWVKKSYTSSILEGELESNATYDANSDKEAKWSREDLRNKKECVTLLGYDPFDGFSDADRRVLFGDLMNYLDEDLLEDAFKLSMVIQVVISNNQNSVKKDLVTSVSNISKENEISVRNRSTKQVGKGTLTALMKELRNKDFDDAEVNFYDMLRSPGTLWAMEQSNKALMEHCLFDENDRQEIFMAQRELIQKLQGELDDIKEELRLVKIENKELKDG